MQAYYSQTITRCRIIEKQQSLQFLLSHPEEDAQLLHNYVLGSYHQKKCRIDFIDSAKII